MPHVTSNAPFRSVKGLVRAYIEGVFSRFLHPISSRLLERRIYNETMQELWSMPDKYRLELGIDPYEYKKAAREKARLGSGQRQQSLYPLSAL